LGGIAEIPPGMGIRSRGEATGRGDFREPGRETGPATDVVQAQHDKREESSDDEAELQDFVVDGTGKTTQGGIGQHHPGCR
jgi:hypothetical protein